MLCLNVGRVGCGQMPRDFQSPLGQSMSDTDRGRPDRIRFLSVRCFPEPIESPPGLAHADSQKHGRQFV